MSKNYYDKAFLFCNKEKSKSKSFSSKIDNIERVIKVQEMTMKLDKILNIILISLGIIVVSLVTFVGISANQDHATKHSNYAGS